MCRVPAVEQWTYPKGEFLTLHALSYSQSDVFFGADRNDPSVADSPNKAAIFFNLKSNLLRERATAQQTGTAPQYEYHKSTWALDDFFISPLVLFFSLLLFSPGVWWKRLIGWGIGSLSLVGFSYLAILCRGYYLVATAGILEVSASTIHWYQVLQLACSSVTIITLVVVLWALVLLSANDWKGMLSRQRVLNG